MTGELRQMRHSRAKHAFCQQADRKEFPDLTLDCLQVQNAATLDFELSAPGYIAA